jgi:predicted TIM-barrel fold metal-dependent hydrolase
VSVATFDFHRHVWPPELVEAFRARRKPPCLDGDVLELEPGGRFDVDVEAYGIERLLSELDRDAIDAAVVSCPPTLGIELLPAEEAEPLLRAYHEGILELAGDRVVPLAIGRALDGFAGASVAAADVLGPERIAPLLDELERRNGLLFVHPGAAAPPDGFPAWWVFVVDYAAQMQAAYVAWLAHGIERWPRLRVVLAVLAGGAPIQLERLRSRGVDPRIALRPNLYLDTASYGNRALELCLATYGGSQLLYGSDAPVIDSRPTLEAIRSFGPAVADALCRDNPTALLK